MIKIFSCKCIFLLLLCFTSSVCADDYKSFKLRSLGEVPKVKKPKSQKKQILDKVNNFIGDDIDLEYFNKKKLGWSVYARISKVSKLGMRYNY